MPLPPIEECIPVLDEFLKMKTSDVLSRFANLPQTQVFQPKKVPKENILDYTSVATQGKRDNRMIMVAHADTIPRDEVSIGYEDGLFFSANREVKKDKESGQFYSSGTAIGGDDRCGCAIAWLLRDLGHSSLIVGGEEVGTIGSNYFASNDSRME